MTIKEAFRNWKIRALEGDLASVDHNIKVAHMAAEAEKVAQDGQYPTSKDIAKERQSLYSKRYKILKELKSLTGSKATYQTS